MPAAGQERAGKWTVLGIVGLGVFMATLDSSIVDVSLPSMARYFGVPLSGAIEWVVVAYLVTTAADVTALQGTFVHSFHDTLLVCAAIAAVGIFTSLVRGAEEQRQKRVDNPELSTKRWITCEQMFG